MGEGGEGGHRGVGDVGEGDELVGGELAALVEQRHLGGPDGRAGLLGREPGPLGGVGTGVRGEGDGHVGHGRKG